MFNIFKRGNNKKSGITLVAGNCQLIGDVHFTDRLLVNGVVNGNIRNKGAERYSQWFSGWRHPLRKAHRIVSKSRGQRKRLL